jgi:hypothetical protein
MTQMMCSEHFFPLSSHQPHTAHPYDTDYPTPDSAVPNLDLLAFVPYEPQIQHYVAQLQQNAAAARMHSDQQQHFLAATGPNIRLQQSTPTPEQPASGDRQDSLLLGSAPAFDPDWMYQTSMGGTAINTQGVKRARSGHQRTPSASTVTSTGPASPYTHTYSIPQIANTDYPPSSPAHFADQPAPFSKNLPTPTHTPTDSGLGAQYIPGQVVPGGAHHAMKGFAIDHHTGDDFAPDFAHSSRQSMSSYANSPTTPQSGVGETAQSGQYSLPQNGETQFDKMASDFDDYLLFGDADYPQAQPDVHLFRTDSQAYQDELYNPDMPISATSAPGSASVSKPTNNYLSPHRNLMDQRLQTANLARSQSPMSAVSGVSRERSPFRNGSPLAPANPAGDWQAARALHTAASMRQQQKEQADQAELAAHQPTLQREPTKTISPKDAMLDYNEQEQPSLFRDTVPAGYKMHTGPTEMWPNDHYQAGGSFGTLQTPSQQQQFTGFRATSADSYPATGMSFAPLPPAPEQGQISGSYLNSYLGTTPVKMEPDGNPEFPAHLTRMESSISDNGPPPSSQDSLGTTSAPQRPADTKAGTGTYTCTYHGCTQRFNSHAELQKHKKEYHRSQQQQREASAHTSSAAASTSPRSTESPAPSATGMTSAALMARNSQAGPHKCTRINPSTNKPCNTVFSRPYDLTRHEDTIHNNRKQKVRCHLCREEKTFSRHDALTRHMRVVHPEVETYGKRSKKGD